MIVNTNLNLLILILQNLSHVDYIHIIRTSCVSYVIGYVCKDVFIAIPGKLRKLFGNYVD